MHPEELIDVGLGGVELRCSRVLYHHWLRRTCTIASSVDQSSHLLVILHHITQLLTLPGHNLSQLRYLEVE